MKDYSASQLKRGSRVAIQQLPREGSAVKELYDLFMLYKGQIIHLDYKTTKNRDDYSTRIKYLQIFYGLDIVHVGKGQWRLVGEWFGCRYVSYDVVKPLNIKLRKKHV